MVVHIREYLYDKLISGTIDTILSFDTHFENVFNTPLVFLVYMVNLVLDWVEKQGGLEYFEAFNTRKSALLYDEIDRDEFYRGTVTPESRSKMNVTFRLQNEELEEKFLKEAAENNLVNLKGHRSVGGVRASIYNACSEESVQALVDFMKEFRDKNG